MDSFIELGACLTGFGACYKNMVYALSTRRGYLNLDIIQLETLNALLATRVFGLLWRRRRILNKCDINAVVHILNNSKTTDPFLAAVARNAWYVAAMYDITKQYWRQHSVMFV